VKGDFMHHSELIKEKLLQAIQIMSDLQIDCWCTYVRETIENRDPAMTFLAGEGHVVWEAAFLVYRTGRKVAILGAGDQQNYIQLDVYDEIIPYVESFRQPLRNELLNQNPKRIALNFSPANVSADGLSYGMYQRLQQFLPEWNDRFVSSEKIIETLRKKKTPEEMLRLQASSWETLELFGLLTHEIKPGFTLRKISDYLHNKMNERNLTAAWNWHDDPGITSGPAMSAGHAVPDDTLVEPGHVLHLDFGIKKDGYASDYQRCWYILRPGETQVPQDIQKIFDTVQQGIRLAADFIKPGIQGWQVDEKVRLFLKENGYSDYQHALGHQVGIWAHDGGAVLGPKWERYGQRPFQPLEVGQVFTLEFGLQSSGGYVAQEEMIEVTQSGCRFFLPMQKQIWLIQWFNDENIRLEIEKNR
jgi:Xaa-Pro aminopeptidase